jgi:DNA-binding winged helix-turn-helix (wHTH) protein
MLQSPNTFLIVQKGEPFAVGEALPLLSDKVWLGRISADHEPDFPFHSPYISRRHATIEVKEGSYFLTDLPESRHGTTVNEKQLTPGEPRKLKDRDRISLARDEVVLTFSIASPAGGETWDYPESQPEPPAATQPVSPVLLDQERREVALDGQPLALSGKLYYLLYLLYENQGRAVSALDIKKAVWQERGLGADGMPMVTNEEVTTLVYRLRKRLEPHGALVRTVPGYGYMLDLEQNPLASRRARK